MVKLQYLQAIDRHINTGDNELHDHVVDVAFTNRFDRSVPTTKAGVEALTGIVGFLTVVRMVWMTVEELLFSFVQLRM